MSNNIGRLGVFRPWMWFETDLATAVEELGYGAIWLGGAGPDGDLHNVETLLEATTHILIATSIVDMWKYDPGIVAASYHRITSRHPGRFLLGLGVGHPEVTQKYHRPLTRTKNYLDHLDLAGVHEKDRALAGLGPRVLALAGERTAGAIPYLTTVEHTRVARKEVGAGRLLAPECMVLLSDDADHARDVGREALSFYLTLSNFSNSMARMGFRESDLRDGGSEPLIDALIAWGNADTIAARIRAHLDSGADHVALQVLGEDPLPALRAVSEMMLC